MKYIFFILFAVAIFYSCSYPIRKAYKKSTNQEIDVFNPDFKKVVYRTTIDVYKKHFTGIMVIKKIEKDSSYRLVFLSELGMKIFDFEFNNKLENKFKIHQILEPINKKLLINTLRNDFELFLKYFTEQAKIKTYTSNNLLINKIINNSRYNYYTLNTDSNYVTNITQKGWLFKKLIIDNTGYSNYSPDSASFKHKGIKLNITLSKIK